MSATHVLCPLCRRGYLTLAGVTAHLAEDHSPKALAAELMARVLVEATRATPPKATCHKRHFTEEEAARVLFECKLARGLRGKTKRNERRAYVCKVCSPNGNVWHLTSMEIEEAS